MLQRRRRRRPAALSVLRARLDGLPFDDVLAARVVGPVTLDPEP